ncbi:MAG: hypothetical protein U0572_15500 [Phycisphaerales bacterium]
MATCLALGGCWITTLAGALGNEIERNKKIEVLAQYEGLENRTVAVIVHADASTLYDFPTAAVTIAGNIAFRIQSNVRGVSVLAPATVVQWQYQTPAWTTLPYGQVAEELGVERLVVIDIYEFHLNPPGNHYMWDAVAAANIGVVEADGAEPDSFVDTFDVRAAWPTSGDPLPREAVSQTTVEGGLMAMFVQKSAWLFYKHLEDKYPDK